MPSHESLRNQAIQMIRDHVPTETIRTVTGFSPAVIEAMRQDVEAGRIRLPRKAK